MNPKLRIAVPLSLVVILTTMFVFLLLSEVQPPASDSSLSLGEGSDKLPRRPEAKEKAPAPSPPVAKRRPARAFPKSDGFSRWELSRLPANWDPELARKIHDFFELLDKYERKLRAGAASQIMKKRQELSEFLASLGPDSLDTLATILNCEPYYIYRRFMMVAIGNLGPQTEGATWALKDYFVARQSDASNRSEIGHLVNAMGKLQNDTSFDIMKDLIKNPGYSPYREKFIWELGEHHRREEALDFFNKGLRNEASKTNRNRYAQALGKIASPQSLPELYHAFQNENYWVVKQTILGSIGKIRNPNSIPFLEEHARYAGESGVRLSAARALSRIGTPLAMNTLRDVAQAESDEKIQKYMINWSQEQQ